MPASRIIESPPSALCGCVFNYRKPYAFSNCKYEKRQLPKSFVSGQELKNYALHISSDIGVVGIVFRPTALFKILGLPMFGLTNERIAFTELFDPNEIERKIEDASSHQEKINLVQHFIYDRLASGLHGTSEIEYAANFIYESRGQCRIPDLIGNAYMSRRKFERKFMEEVGISPKAYARIRRFGYTCLLMAGNREADMMSVLHECGYYDQSHFIKDFKYFSGRTPGSYLKTNEELANYVDNMAIIAAKIQFPQT